MSELAKYIDHTFLKPDGDKNAIRKLCREAKKFGFASVCVNSAEVPLAVKLLKGSDVKVCTVIGFPLGQDSAEAKAASAALAIKAGAQELDMVMNNRLFRFDRTASMREMVLFNDFARERYSGIITKLIIECCYLTDEEKILACSMAKVAGFDFVKTSTGFGPSGATVEDVKLMRKTVGKKMGVKAAGGIRDRATAEAMIKAGANRLGCSASVEICK